MLITVAYLTFALLAQSLQARSNNPARLSTEDNKLQRRATSDLIPLGSAGNYAVFTFTGIATVAGTVANGNVVYGDIGVAPITITAITGFGAVKEGASNTPFVTGFIHAPPYTTNTQADVINAYNVAAGKTPSGAIVTGAGTLDSGVVMTPGVYRWTGAVALGVGKTLTLNGGCGDVFIFQTAGAITTGANSNVVLTGGLTAASVYWVSATTLSTGVASNFAGIILTGTNVVIAGTLVGAVYAQTEVALHQASIFLPIVGLSTLSNSQGSITGSVCANCAPGSGFSAGSCKVCTGSFASAGGLAPCARCSGSNVVNAQGVCAPSVGTIATSSTTGYASQCSPGYFADGNMLACLICPAGSFGAGGIVSGSNNACTLCSAGQHTLNDASGSTSISACISCAPTGTSLTGARSCMLCPNGSNDGLSCIIPQYYNVLVRDIKDTYTVGYLSKTISSLTGMFYPGTRDSALIIQPPTFLSSTLPQNLVGTTNPTDYSPGSNIDIATLIGEGKRFAATSTDTVVITSGTQQDLVSAEFDQRNAFSTIALAGSKVWILHDADSQGRIPLSLNFLNLGSVITCAHFFLHGSLFGASCANPGILFYLDNHVLLYLEKVL